MAELAGRQTQRPGLESRLPRPPGAPVPLWPRWPVQHSVPSRGLPQAVTEPGVVLATWVLHIRCPASLGTLPGLPEIMCLPVEFVWMTTQQQTRGSSSPWQFLPQVDKLIICQSYQPEQEVDQIALCKFTKWDLWACSMLSSVNLKAWPTGFPGDLTPFVHSQPSKDPAVLVSYFENRFIEIQFGKFTCLKHTVQFFVVCWHSSATITTIRFREFLSHPEETLCPRTVTSCFLFIFKILTF